MFQLHNVEWIFKHALKDFGSIPPVWVKQETVSSGESERRHTHMLKFKKGCTVFLAVGLIAAMCIPSRAGENPIRGGRTAAGDGRSTASEEEQYGHTTVSILVARKSLANVSFTVPLTVTMAVEEGVQQVHVPDGYSIVNASQPGADGSAPFDIAVVRMEFTKLENSTYNTVEGPAVTGDRNMLFRIGNVIMPALNAPGTEEVRLRAANSQFLEDPRPGHYENSPWKKIRPAEPDNKLVLDLEGTVAGTANLTDNPGVDQFRVTYIMSPLNAAGDPLGVYAGDDHEKAGLGPFTP